MKRRSLEGLEDSIISLRQYQMGDDNTRSRAAMKMYLKIALESELTDRQRECIMQHFFLGKTLTEIASEAELNVSTISFHIKQGLKKLKKSSVYVNIINSVNE